MLNTEPFSLPLSLEQCRTEHSPSICLALDILNNPEDAPSLQGEAQGYMQTVFHFR